MRKSLFTEAQLIGILKEAETGRMVTGLCCEHGITQATARYRARRGNDQRLRGLLRELAQTRRRFGYRRLAVMLQRLGERSVALHVNPDSHQLSRL